MQRGEERPEKKNAGLPRPHLQSPTPFSLRRLLNTSDCSAKFLPARLFRIHRPVDRPSSAIHFTVSRWLRGFIMLLITPPIRFAVPLQSEILPKWILPVPVSRPKRPVTSIHACRRSKGPLSLSAPSVAPCLGAKSILHGISGAIPTRNPSIARDVAAASQGGTSPPVVVTLPINPGQSESNPA